MGWDTCRPAAGSAPEGSGPGGGGPLQDALGLATGTDTLLLRSLLERLGLPTEPSPGLDPDALLARMRLDKKAHAAGLRFVLWDGIGRARVVADVPEEAVLGVLRGAA